MANHLRFVGTGFNNQFRIEVDGRVWPGDQIADHARIDEFHDPNAAWIEYSDNRGHPLSNGAEAWWFYEGTITGVNVMSGSVDSYLNDNLAPLDQIEAHYAHDGADRLVFIAGSDSEFSYSVSVTGGIAAGSGFSSNGNTSSNSASDTVSDGAWSDVYYSGDISDLTVGGNGAVYHNCEQVDVDQIVGPSPGEIEVSTNGDVTLGVEDIVKYPVTVSNVGSTTFVANTEFHVGSFGGSRRFEVAPGETKTVQFDLNGPNHGVGTHSYQVLVNGETKDTGTVTVTEATDWSIDTIGDVAIAEVETVRYPVTITNAGPSHDFKVVFRVGDHHGVRRFTLDSGESHTAEFDLNGPNHGVGKHGYEVIVNGKVADSGTVTVDHVADWSVFSPDSATVNHDETVPFPVRVVNEGSPHDFNVVFSVGPHHGSRSFSLDSGEETTLEYDLNGPNHSPGTHQFQVIVNGKTAKTGPVTVVGPGGETPADDTGGSGGAAALALLGAGVLLSRRKKMSQPDESTLGEESSGESDDPDDE